MLGVIRRGDGEDTESSMSIVTVATGTGVRSPRLSEEEYIHFKIWQEGMRRRYHAALRLHPYEHRPWDRGFNIHERGEQ